jgi:uncharacterized protein YqhQ
MIIKVIIIIFLSAFLVPLLLMDAYLINSISNGNVTLSFSNYDPNQTDEYNEAQKSSIVVNKDSSTKDIAVVGLVLAVTLAMTIGLIAAMYSIIKNKPMATYISGRDT